MQILLISSQHDNHDKADIENVQKHKPAALWHSHTTGIITVQQGLKMFPELELDRAGTLGCVIPPPLIVENKS